MPFLNDGAAARTRSGRLELNHADAVHAGVEKMLPSTRQLPQCAARFLPPPGPRRPDAGHPRQASWAAGPATSRACSTWGSGLPTEHQPADGSVVRLLVAGRHHQQHQVVAAMRRKVERARIGRRWAGGHNGVDARALSAGMPHGGFHRGRDCVVRHSGGAMAATAAANPCFGDGVGIADHGQPEPATSWRAGCT